jgi:hypothetical protein
LFWASVLALLLPLAVYCWVLATINRRDKPTMVSGLWDCVGLLAALSGVLLVVIPILLERFFVHLVAELPFSDEDFEPAFARLVRQWWFFWAAYYALVAIGVGLMLWWRRSKTVVYNVDADLFDQALHDALGRLGLAHVRTGDRLVIAPKSKPTEAAGAGVAPASPVSTLLKDSTRDLTGELAVEAFAPMCNVSLHWLRGQRPWRTAIEHQLERGLEEARIFDNPAANWFLGTAGLLFSLVFLTGTIWLLTVYLSRRFL